MRTLLLASAAVFVLAGCAAVGPTHEELIAQDKAACTDYGFKPGTDGFGNCMLQLSAIQAADYRARQERIAVALAAFRPRPSVTCNTYATANSGFGNSVTGNSTTTCQ